MHVAIVGDLDPANPNHRATEAALAHSGLRRGTAPLFRWWGTDELLRSDALAEVAGAAGIWCTTGSPYRSLDGALAAIRVAREHAIPFLGTCGGFQHAVVEFARHVAGIGDAGHQEYGDASGAHVVSALACSLAGKWFEVEIDPTSRTAACYGSHEARERYYCSYGINPRWLSRLVAAGLPIVGRANDGTPRIIELGAHPFFVATLFVPQARSTPQAPHPLVDGFLAACAERLAR